jgi:hypothetical protein
MRRDDDQELWDLLGKAAQPQLSAFFARDVVRRIRQQPRRLEWARNWLSLRSLIPASGVAVAVAIALIIAGQHPGSPRPVATDSEPEVVAKIDPQDYEVVADLDELLAADESSLWDDNQTL